jgi:hypothetical protein
MNPKWLKQNALVVGFIAGFLILLGGVIWLQRVASENRTEVDAALDEQQSQLQHFLQEKPGPSRDNIDIVVKDREQVDHLYGRLMNTVGHAIEPPADLRPVGFLQLMASTFAHLRQAADPAGVKLQDGFAFGFGHYAGPPPTLPARNLSPEDSKRVLGLLVKQLRAIDQISTLLIDSHVDEINQIRRSELEPTGSTETFDAPVISDPNTLYEVLPFEFQFACSSDALRTFLNSLTKSDLFFAVRRVQVIGEAPSSDKAPAGGPAAAIPTIAKHAHLSVTMRIDLIEFPKKQPDKKETGKPGA